MNNLDDDIEKELLQVLMRTNDDFGVTLSSNKMSDEVLNKLHGKIRKQHGFNIELAVQQAETDG